MFVRTQRLTLRPGWPEDAPQLARAIGHECVARMLGRVPWPYALGDAEAFLAEPPPVAEPRFLIFAHEGPDVRLVGGIGIHAFEDSPHQIGYWIAPDAWGRGYATEAGRGVLAATRALGVRRVTAQHFLDNPASGRVLCKLGFRPTGEVRTTHSRGRGGAAEAMQHVCNLAAEGEQSTDPDATHRMAA